MNQTFKKKVIALSVAGAFAFGSGAVFANQFANQFEASSSSTPTAVVVKRGGLPQMTDVITLTEVGAWAAGVIGVPQGIRFTIPAGLELYGSYLDGTNVGATTAISATATKFAPTAGMTYPIRYIKGTTELSSFVFIDTALGTTSPNADGTFTTTTFAASKQLAIFAVDGSSSAGVQLGLNNVSLKTGTTSALSTFFAGGTAANGYGVTTTAGVATGDVYLTSQINQATDNTIGNSDSSVVGYVKAETDGSLTFQLYAVSPAAGTEKLLIPKLALAASATAATGNYNISVADGIGSSPATASLLGITATSQKIATVAADAAVLTYVSSTATTPTGPVGAVGQNIRPFKISFSDAFAAAAANGATVTITLDKGAKFKTSYTTLAALAITDNLTSVTPTATAAAGTIVITMDNAAIAAGDNLVVNDGTVTDLLDLSAATAGDITATVTSTLAGFGTQSIVVAKAADRANTITYKDNSPTGYDVLYTGRATESVTDGVVITESAAGSLLSGGSLTVALSSGAKFVASSTITNTTAAVDTTGGTALAIANITANSTANATATGSVGTASVGAPYKDTITFATSSLDLTNATAGDLTVTIGGTGGASGSVKVAEIKDATSVSTSGSVSTVAANTAISLPDIVLTESAVGAIPGTDSLVVQLPAGYVLTKPSGSPAADGDANGSSKLLGITVTAKKADGTDVTSTLLGTTPAVTFQSDGTNVNRVAIEMAGASSTSTGVLSYTISGIKATTPSTAAAGDINAIVSSVPDATAISAAAATGDIAGITSNAGKTGASKHTSVKVGAIVAAGVPSIPAATVTGSNTAQSITAAITPAGNDQGKLGAVFVAAVLPSSLGGGVYFMSSTGAWTMFTSCAAAPTYSSGSLTAIPSIKVTDAMNVAGLVGTDVYVGYGIGGALSPAGTACTNMLNNGTYNLTYTIK